MAEAFWTPRSLPFVPQESPVPELPLRPALQPVSEPLQPLAARRTPAEDSTHKLPLRLPGTINPQYEWNPRYRGRRLQHRRTQEYPEASTRLRSPAQSAEECRRGQRRPPCLRSAVARALGSLP